MNTCLKVIKNISFIKFTLNLEVEIKDQQYISSEAQLVGNFSIHGTGDK